MKHIRILALGAALMAAPALMASPAEAGGSFGFSIHKPGFSFHIGKDRHHWRGRHWRKRHWRGRRHARRYHYWKRKCHRRWGYGWDYRRCMDRHGY